MSLLPWTPVMLLLAVVLVGAYYGAKKFKRPPD